MNKAEMEKRKAELDARLEAVTNGKTFDSNVNVRPSSQVTPKHAMHFISKQLFEELTEKQRILDAAIIKEKNLGPIEQDQIELAYRLEIAETVNEMKGDVKYWSFKEWQRPEFLEEYVDALHFFLSWTYNKADREAHELKYLEGENRIAYMHRMFIKEINEIHIESDLLHPDVEPWRVAFAAIKAAHMEASFAYLTILAQRYGIQEHEIKDAYYAKNAENFKRLESGY